jgi:hypothetical protein
LAQPTLFPAGKDKSTPAIGNLLWNRLKYAEKVLIIVLPILAAFVCAASCLYFFRKEVSKKPNLDLSFREAHSAGKEAALWRELEVVKCERDTAIRYLRSREEATRQSEAEVGALMRQLIARMPRLHVFAGWHTAWRHWTLTRV